MNELLTVQAQPCLSPGDCARQSEDLLLRWASSVVEADAVSQPYLNAGSALNALVLRQAALRHGREDFAVRAAQHLERAMGLQDKLPLSSSLYRGICGIGWVLARFDRSDLLPWREQALDDIDALLADGVEVTSNLNIDVVNGLAGIAIYALARETRTESAKVLWQVLEEKIGGYLSRWLQEDPASRRRDSAGNNLGVAHGVPGLLCVAASGVARGLLGQSVRELVCSGLDALWRHRIETAGQVCFASYMGATSIARLAWCYGSFGVAAAFKSGAALDPANRQRLRQLCESALLQFESPTRLLNDASLCHGHAGAALSTAWLARSGLLSEDLAGRLQALSVRAATDAFACEQSGRNGPVFLHSTKDGPLPSASLLEGGAGVALALDAAFSAQNADWTELLAYH